MDLDNPIAKGNTAKIYHADNKIIKIYNDFLTDAESLNEAKKQEYAYSCGLPVPKVIDVTKINGKQAMIMEYIRGETLGNLMFLNNGKVEHYLSISVDIQMKIHSIKPNQEAIESMNIKLNRQIETATIITKKQKTDLLHKMSSITFENRLCHGDFHLYNLIKTGCQVVVIDWMDSSMGDIHADVYRTYLLYSQLSMELADVYLRLYCDKSGISRSDVFQWAPVIAGARLSEHVSTERTERLMEIVNHY
ncbi:aminoglycoside phosphotransferase family protein [Metabacillus sp. HB246100]